MRNSKVSWKVLVRALIRRDWQTTLRCFKEIVRR